MIFVDSIDSGKTLRKKFLDIVEKIDEKVLKEEDVVFLDANYEKDDESRESVNQIVKEKLSSKKVLISTAVMDNGVSLFDLDLKNIVIFADTKEEFIQMLGRKRKDGGKVNLYVCKQNINHFIHRRDSINKVIKYFDDRENIFLKLCAPYKYIDDNTNHTYVELIMRSFFNYAPCYIVQNEYQQEILYDLLSNSIFSQHIKKMCYSANGHIIPNQFSIDRLNQLYVYYDSIIKKLEQDEYAFVKEQASWIGISEEESLMMVDQSIENLETKNRKILKNSIQKIVEGNENSEGMSEDENKKWKCCVKDYLIYFLRKDEETTDNDIKNIKQNDRALSKKLFMRCMQQAKLPYVMKVKNRNEKHDTQYIIYIEQSGLKEKAEKN